MRRFVVVMAVPVTAACSTGPKLPPPNSCQATFDRSANAVEVIVSAVAPASGAALVLESGERYAASGLAILSSPHVAYQPPPSIGLGFGGFGFGSGAGFGSDVGVGLPVGSPTVSEVSNQFVVSAAIPVPPDDMAAWRGYHVEVISSGTVLTLPAPAPG